MQELEEHSHRETTPREPDIDVDVLSAQLQDLEDRLRTAGAFLDSTSDHIIPAIEAAGPGASVDDIIEKLREVLKRQPLNFYLIQQALQEYVSTTSEYEDLQRNHHGALEARQHATREQLLQTLDWDRVIDALLQSDETKRNTQLIDRLRRLKTRKGSQDFKAILAELRDLDATTAFLHENGYLSDPHDEDAEHTLPAEQLKEFIQDWGDTTIKAILYKQPADIEYYAQLFAQTGLDDIAALLAYSRGLPPGFAHTLEKRATIAIQNFDAADEAHTTEMAKRAPNVLYIGKQHQDALRQNTFITDVPEWLHHMFNQFPHRFIDGIGIVEFTEAAHPDHDDWLDAGEYIPNRLEIDTLTHVKPALAEKGQSPDTIRTGIQSAIEETLYHEIGHHIHFSVLTIRELRIWQEAVEASGGARSDQHEYVQKVFQAELVAVANGTVPNSVRTQREQFATSLAEYMEEPHKLIRRNRRLYLALNKIIGKYSPDTTDVPTPA